MSASQPPREPKSRHSASVSPFVLSMRRAGDHSRVALARITYLKISKKNGGRRFNIKEKRLTPLHFISSFPLCFLPDGVHVHQCHLNKSFQKTNHTLNPLNIIYFFILFFSIILHFFSFLLVHGYSSS